MFGELRRTYQDTLVSQAGVPNMPGVESSARMQAAVSNAHRTLVAHSVFRLLSDSRMLA